MEIKMNKTILMPLMGLNIGGAETHVLELALELNKRGINVIVASNGGVYEQELENAGIKHYTLPLNTRSAKDMLVSLIGMLKIVKKEDVDLIHAHGRIPSFVAGFVHKMTGIPFMTTAHWVFSTEGMLRHLTNWGEKCIAVSEDIKKYLMDEYNYPEKNISTTINGIDTQKFSPQVDYSDVINEFGLSYDTYKIVYCSRLDEDRAKVAIDLIKISGKLVATIPNLEVIIVGDGNVFEDIKKTVDYVNGKVGRKLITLTGARRDINKFAAMSDIFVAVSRAALEAMSCAKPVIVAGNEGYIGIFDETKLDVAVETNFTCRGCDESTEQALFTDIVTLYNMDADSLEKIRAYSRNTVIDSYSVTTMANDCCRVYRTFFEPQKEYDVMISGYYGFKNSGDDALLLAVIENLRKVKPDITICVLSNNPEETKEAYNVDSINRYSFALIRKYMKKTRLFISGGGSLLQDVTSTKSLHYYTTLISMAQGLGLKTMLYANGIGPIEKDFNRERVRKVLSRTDVVTLRDFGSMEFLKEIDVRGPEIYVAADPALSLVPASDKEVYEELTAQGIDLNRRYFGVCVREWKSTTFRFKSALAGTLDHVYKTYGVMPLFIPMKYPDDLEFSKQINDLCEGNYPVIEKAMPVRTMLGAISHLDFMLGMRLHSIIYSTANYLPTVGLVYDPKVRSYMDELGLDTFIDVEAVSFETLKALVDEVVVNQENISAKMTPVINSQRSYCYVSAEYALKLIEDTYAKLEYFDEIATSSSDNHSESEGEE